MNEVTSAASSNLTSNGIPIRNIWYMLSYAWNDRRFLSRWKADVESAPTIEALLARILLNLTKQRLRIGLGRNYRNFESSLNGIRGRVDFSASLKKLSFENGKAHCRYQTFDANVLKNQIIRSTLNHIAATGEFSSGPAGAKLRRELRVAVRELSYIDFVELRPSVIKRQQLERDDSDYRFMLLLCYLIATRQMPTEDSGKNESQHVDRDWKYVCKLFESFVANFYKHHLLDWSVSPQKNFYWPTTSDSKYLPIMKPDLVLIHRDTGLSVVLDTKFTAKSLQTGQFGNLTFNQSHVYQLYAYMRSQEKKLKRLTGILLYPAANYQLQEQVQMEDQVMRWQTLDLAQPWVNIESDLLALPELVVETFRSEGLRQSN